MSENSRKNTARRRIVLGLTAGLVAAGSAFAVSASAANDGSQSGGTVYWCVNAKDSSKNYAQFRAPLPHNCQP